MQSYCCWNLRPPESLSSAAHQDHSGDLPEWSPWHAVVTTGTKDELHRCHTPLVLQQSPPPSSSVTHTFWPGVKFPSAVSVREEGRRSVRGTNHEAPLCVCSLVSSSIRCQCVFSCRRRSTHPALAVDCNLAWWYLGGGSMNKIFFHEWKWEAYCFHYTVPRETKHTAKLGGYHQTNSHHVTERLLPY